MVNLIPMAGAGSRFTQEGYKDPKPLIQVSGKPMIVRACSSLPEASRWIFVCRGEHINQYGVDRVLQEYYPGCDIIRVDYLTEGQASTCMLAKDLLDPDQPLTIGACDNGMTWDREAFKRVWQDPGVDALIWTFRHNATVKRNPQMYGWVETGADQTARRVSCKKPLSDSPDRDHAIIGAFTFKSAAIFTEATQTMMEKNRRINGEFYVDVVMDEVIRAGYRVKVFEVDQYICWGTPNDLRTYEYWETYFGKKQSAG